jgi:hypothetical protein
MRWLLLAAGAPPSFKRSRNSVAHPDIPSANLHTPGELLDVAEKLLASDDADVRRAVVLESITALEAFVQQTVFRLLERTMDPLLVKWLDDKSRMDFDARLGIIAPVALGQAVDKSSKLWTDYKRARAIRNGITHAGRRVSRDEATFVLATVRAWLGYLGSTAEVAVALDGLKDWVEAESVFIPNGRAAVELVDHYFSGTSAARVRDAAAGSVGRADLVLSFGPETVVVEVKVVPRGEANLEPWIHQAAIQVGEYARALGGTRGAAVLFVRDTPPEAYATARFVGDPAVTVIVIQARSLPADPKDRVA